MILGMDDFLLSDDEVDEYHESMHYYYVLEVVWQTKAYPSSSD
jgi:hypothetical protein